MQQLLITIFGVFLLLGGMGLAIMLGVFFGRTRQRRCACAEAKRVARIIEDRKRQEREARKYSPEKVNPNSLPIVDAETAGKY